MTFWQSFTATPPLDDERDVWARVGFRFTWCTGPFFLLTYTLSALGVTAMVSPWLMLTFFAVPVVGGVADWRRLKRRTERTPGAAA